jgi:hypothetical protein
MLIKVIRDEFTQADSDGAIWGVYGYVVPNLYIYAELGEEGEYLPKDGDDPRADYRLFTNCYVEYYRTMEDLKSGNVITNAIEEKVTLIICC